MKRSFFFLAGSILLLHLISCLFFIWLTDAGSLVRQKEKSWSVLPKPVPVWVMGDSHALYGLNPKEIGGCYNFASTSEYYTLVLQRLKKLLSEENKPQTIILTAGWHSFSPMGKSVWLNHELDDVFWSQLIQPRNFPKGKETPEIWRWWLGARLAPYAGQYYQWTRIWKPWVIEPDPLGFVSGSENFNDQSPSERKRLSLERLKAHFKQGFEPDSIQIKSLLEIRKICLESQIQLLLVRLPVTKEYKEAFLSKGGLSKLQPVWENLPEDVPVLELSTDKSISENWFSDPDHLNANGARWASNEIRKYLNIRRKPDATH